MTATLERTKMLSDIEERALRKSIATKDEFGMCSSVKIPINRVNGSKDFVLRDSLSKVNYIAETYGVRSNQFYNCITNFIMKVIHRYVPYDLVCEDILNETFIKVIIAFEGGWQEKGKDHKKIYKKAYYDPAKCKNIGNFIFTLARNETTRFMTAQKKWNLCDDITEHQNKKNYSDEEYSHFCVIEDIEEIPYKFKYFEFNDNFKHHLNSICKYKPKNNILYSLMQWGEYQDVA